MKRRVGERKNGSVGELTSLTVCVHDVSHSPAHPLTRSRKAFTLLELLVALVVLGILGTAIAGVLKNSTDSVAQGTQALDHLTRIRSLEVVLGGALRDARALELSGQEKRLLEEDGAYDATEGDVRFRGEPEMLGFCIDRPFLGAERDGYMHWVTLEVRTDEETDFQSLWLSDVAYVNGVDNPVGEDWADTDLSSESTLTTQEVQLMDGAKSIVFRYWELDDESTSGEPEPLEMEPEDIEGDYALELPDYVEMEISMPKAETEMLQFDYSIRRKGI